MHYQILIFYFFLGKQLVRYSIISGDIDNVFTIEPHTGAIRTSGRLDRETTGSYLLNVKASTGSPASYDQTQVNINKNISNLEVSPGAGALNCDCKRGR